MIPEIIGLILLYCAYAYLRNLNNCDCVNQIYTNKLKDLESFFIVLSIIGLISSFFMVDLSAMATKYISYAVFIMSVIMIIVYAYFVYDTYMFSTTMQANCLCAEGWQKYYIYFQAFSMMLILVAVAFTIITILENPGIIRKVMADMNKPVGYQGKNYKTRSQRRK